MDSLVFVNVLTKKLNFQECFDFEESKMLTKNQGVNNF